MPAPCGHCRQCEKVLRGVHPDITYVEREKDAKEIKVDQMRAVRAASLVLPNDAARSVYIVRDADLMRNEAQNAMLKVFEEPAPHVVFILLAANAERLIGTVRSRCVELVLPPRGHELPELTERLFSAGTRYDILSAALEFEKLSRPELVEAISSVKACALREFSAGRLDGEKFGRIAENMNRAEKYMVHNVSAGYVSGLIMTAFI